jgi:hypothetical protein
LGCLNHGSDYNLTIIPCQELNKKFFKKFIFFFLINFTLLGMIFAFQVRLSPPVLRICTHPMGESGSVAHSQGKFLEILIQNAIIIL